MIVEKIDRVKDYPLFARFSATCYRECGFHRSTELDVEKLVIKGPSVFHTHTKINCYLLRESNSIVGRFALIFDSLAPHSVKVSFFEALPDCGDILTLIRRQIRHEFPDVHHFTVGINGHLNYSAGFLLDRFEEPPVFGLPYSHHYYPSYFSTCKKNTMVSFRFPIEKFFHFTKQYSSTGFNAISIRCMDKRHIRRAAQEYTLLNNKAFSNHPFWTDRTVEEDLELFRPFSILMNNENLLFADYDNQTVGFLLWYPDFNQLVAPNQNLGLFPLLKYRFKNPIDTIRFTEIGVLPAYEKKAVSLALICALASCVEQQQYRYCEAGFIFLQNKKSISITTRYLKRVVGIDALPYRTYAVFEGTV